MNKYIKYIGMLSLLCFSFYYTEQVALFMQQKDPLYESILVSKEDYSVQSVNAVVEDKYVIPGLMGQEVDVTKSFQNMKNIGFFTEQQLVFESIKPTISVEEHQDKIIRQGNSQKNAVAFLVKSEKIIQYLEEMGIYYTELTTLDNMNIQRAYGTKLNMDVTNYKTVENTLKEQKKVSKYCYNKTSSFFCQKQNKQQIEASIELNNSNFINNYQKITSGTIVLLQDSLSITNLKFLLNKIYFQGLEIISLDSLLSESR